MNCQLNVDVFRCVKCNKFSNQYAASVQCHHLLCWFCREDSGLIADCPPCEKRRDWIRTPAISAIASSFTTKCPHKSCNTMLKLINYDAHRETCPFRTVECKTTMCSWKGSAVEMLEHVCPYERVECTYCKNTFYRGAHNRHVVDCNYYQIECSVCGEKHMRWEIEFHKGCPVPCNQKR